MSEGTETYCDVCGRRDSYGCGHDSRQRAAARRHNATKTHLAEMCHHYTAEPAPGWAPAVHSDEWLAARGIDPAHRFKSHAALMAMAAPQ